MIVSSTRPCVVVWCFGETVALRTWRPVGWWHPASLTSMWHLAWQNDRSRDGTPGKNKTFPAIDRMFPVPVCPHAELGSQPPSWCQMLNKTPKISTQVSGTREKEGEGRGTLRACDTLEGKRWVSVCLLMQWLAARRNVKLAHPRRATPPHYLAVFHY